MSHKGFSFWLLLIATAVILLGIITGAFEIIKLGNIILGYGFAASFAVLWTRFFLTKWVNIDEEFLKNPVALALYSGSVCIAGALASSLL